jgi:Fur family transcriptional regulator, peroxide stress response regulator
MERRKSKLRERIFDLIMANKDHPTAQWVYDTLRNECPSVSLGTVYRNLNILTEEKRIECKKFHDGTEHYDATTQSHYHFICEQCGSIIDMPMPFQAQVTELAKCNSAHEIHSHTIQYFGICEKCLHSKTF